MCMHPMLMSSSLLSWLHNQDAHIKSAFAYITTIISSFDRICGSSTIFFFIKVNASSQHGFHSVAICILKTKLACLVGYVLSKLHSSRQCACMYLFHFVNTPALWRPINYTNLQGFKQVQAARVGKIKLRCYTRLGWSLVGWLKSPIFSFVV